MNSNDELNPPKDLSHYFSENAKNRNASPFKQFYKYFAIPGIGNLAGGLPHYSYFPYDTLEASVASPLRFSGKSESDHIVVPKVDGTGGGGRNVLNPPLDIANVLQYGTAQGFPVLYQWLKDFTRNSLHSKVPYEGGVDIVLSCGNTDGMHKALATLSNDWSEKLNLIEDRQGLLVEKFCYMMAVDQAKYKGLNIVPVDMDHEGLLAEDLENVLSNWDYSRGKRPHLLYTVSTGQNPTGGVVSLERRKEIYSVCSKYDVIIIEDEPYWFLQYPVAEGVNKPVIDSTGYPFLNALVKSYLEIDTDGRVIRLDTFSKNVAPGCRLGWITGQPDIIEKVLRISEGSTQQPSGFVQALIGKLIGAGEENSSGSVSSSLSKSNSTSSSSISGWSFDGWVKWLEGLRDSYQQRMIAMCTILDEGKIIINEADDGWSTIHHKDDNTRYSFFWPRAGMFVWLKVHFYNHKLSTIFTTEELSTALWIWMTRKPNLILLSPGRMFCPSEELLEEGDFYYRLCFAAIEEEDIKTTSERIPIAINTFWDLNEQEIKELIEASKANIEALNEDVYRLQSVFGC